jgi:FkbM family methyltransferase
VTTLIRALGRTYYRALGYYPISINGLKFKVDPYHFSFWRKAAKGRWEPNTYAIISKFINVDSVYCDVGAWIGPTVIYAAKQCKQVICFEPDPIAYRYLLWNIELNELQNVTSFSIALATRTAIQRMANFGSNLGDSSTSLLNDNQEKTGVDVLTLTWKAFIDFYNIHKIDFLKIDIEGAEFDLIPTLKDYISVYKPIVYLSTHAPLLDVSLRNAKMQQIIDVMGIYKKWLNENFKQVDISELSSEDALNHFYSYIFMD